MAVGVLTVDDQEFFRSAAREVIDATPGFTSAGQASSGAEALELLEEGTDAQLALVDVRMPGMDGVQCAQRMKATQPDLVVVLISIEDSSGVPAGVAESGAAEFVRKQDFGPSLLRALWSQHGSDRPAGYCRKGAVRRMLREYFTGTAAELAYYGLLSAVPSIAAFVGILGLLGSHPETTQAITEIAKEGSSIEAAGLVGDAARGVVERNEAAGFALGAGLLTTVWIASVYLAAFRRAAYRVHGADPGSAWKARPLHMLITFVGLLVLAIVAIALTVTKRIMRAVGDAVGAEDATVTLWSVGRWPLALFLLVVMTASLYRLAPREEGKRARVFTAGSVAAVLLWLVASVGFEVWVANFASYDATYGALAGAIAFAIWLWISNLALLFGLVLDLELAPVRVAEWLSALLSQRTA